MQTHNLIFAYATFFPQSAKACSHVYAAVRELGTTVYWDGCDFSNDSFIDHTCNTLEDLEELNCKLYGYELGM